MKSSASPRAALAVVLVLYAASRLCRLTLIPVFVDEAIHILWAHGPLGAGLRSALADGKLLQILACAVPVRLASDALWMARFVSVCVGGVGLWAMSTATARLAGERAGLAAALLYVVCPFAFFYDRLA